MHLAVSLAINVEITVYTSLYPSLLMCNYFFKASFLYIIYCREGSEANNRAAWGRISVLFVTCSGMQSTAALVGMRRAGVIMR